MVQSILANTKAIENQATIFYRPNCYFETPSFFLFAKLLLLDHNYQENYEIPKFKAIELDSPRGIVLEDLNLRGYIYKD